MNQRPPRTTLLLASPRQRTLLSAPLVPLITALIVHTERVIADTLAQILGHNGYRANAAYDAASALTLAQCLRPGVIIADSSLLEHTGPELAQALASLLPDCNVLLLAPISTRADMPSASLGRIHLLSRPLHPNELLGELSRLGLPPNCQGAAAD